MADDLPEFEFSDELESEFERMRAEQSLDSENAPRSMPQAMQASNAASAEGSKEAIFYAWQVCLADMASNSLANADDYPNYLINREPIMQMLGIGMASGKNAFPTDDATFVAAISIQDEATGEAMLIGSEHPSYADVAAVVSEELLSGKDHGMVAQLPNGKLIAIQPPVNPSQL